MTGAYTEIVEIIVPSSAVAGETVSVEVKVKNLHSAGIYMVVTGRVDDTILLFGSVYHIVPAGAIQSFYDSFVMPNSSVTLWVWSWYWGDNNWQVIGEGDDKASKDIALTGVPTSDISNFDFKVPFGTYNLGQSISYVAPYEYKGKSQSGWLTIELGTGVFPLFITKYAFPRIAVTFSGSADWLSGEITGSFTLPVTLEPGQTYSVRAKLETADGKQETDTDWGVFSITPEEAVETLRVDITPIGWGHVVTEPASEEGRTEWVNGSTGTFPYGTQVKVTAYPKEGYRFEKWSDEIVGGVSYDNPSYVQDMTEHRAVKAHFRELGEEPTFTDFKMEAIDGQSIPLSEIITKVEGEVLKVAYSFKYMVISSITINIWASLYQVTRTELAQTKSTITLDKALDWQLYEGEIDIVIGAVSSGVLYGVICELPDYNIEDKIADCIEVTAPPSIWEMIIPILILGLLTGIIAPMMKEGSK